MKNNRGVTLVELSIVIAIIGLLLAATVEGYNVRKSSELRSFMTDITTYQNAIEGFFSKYGTLPGDMPDAYTYWDDGSSGVCGTSTQCNGNNDGHIDAAKAYSSNNPSTFDGSQSESIRAWQHLLLSDFLGGGYTGVGTTVSAAVTMQADAGVNIPASKRTKVGYSIFYDNDATSTLFDKDPTTGDGARNEINLGAFYASNINTNSALTPQEALAIDIKLDDGNPATGRVHGVDGSDATSGACMSGSSYTIATTTTACRVTFPARFQ